MGYIHPEAANREAPGGLTLGFAVFSTVLFFVTPELFVDPGMGNELVLFLRFQVLHQEVLVVVNADDTVFYLEHHLFPHGPVGNGITIGIVGDPAVPVDLAEDLERGVVIRGRQPPKMWNLFLPSIPHGAVMGAMDTPVGSVIEPVSDVFIGFFERSEGIAPPEPFADVINGALDLPLHPGTVRRRRQGLKAVVMGKVEKLDIEYNLSLTSADNDVLPVVVDYLQGDSLKISECPDVAVHEAFQGAAPGKLDVSRPAVAQHQHEGKNRGRPAGRLHDLECTPVELGLAAG